MESRPHQNHQVQHILGICLGASTVSMVHLTVSNSNDTISEKRPLVANAWTVTHEGNPRKTLSDALAPLTLKDFNKIVATGRRFKDFVNFTAISEPEAVEYAYHYARPPHISCPAIVSAGGETFMVYVLNRQGRISNVITGNKCASGTGEFFLQQLRRMNASLEEAGRWAVDETPYHVSGRCSVFCKSDCTHATNKGIPKSRVTAGLCRMMANKILELLKKVDRRDIMVIGGTTHNRVMMKYLCEEIPGLIIPKEAPYFEALGAALWATENRTREFKDGTSLFTSQCGIFDTLSPLKNFLPMVDFKTMSKDIVRKKDICTLGLDVGSTTTKAVLLRNRDNAILASVYLRTDGDPVGASRRCYGAILDQIEKHVDPKDITLTGLGVCGSGRQIAGLHALTDGIINEIIAHASAAVHFDPKVDTILEIGGQDAKYTYIVNSVPADYAMNEACSAGTGSFLEESALESLGVKMSEIGDIALTGENPPNFNDQCAAFIASDIKNAIHEGARHEDIVAGLVYSICMNYANRVKGNRPVGQTVFMQGGVCYNRAVPAAMAALIGKPIIVPPEPGLMGAFGVALEVKKRIKLGILEEKAFDLKSLACRVAHYKDSFICKGGKEKCDRRCSIARIMIENRVYPFGGACNRYYNLRRSIRLDVENLDMVRVRRKLVFDTYGYSPVEHQQAGKRGCIGFNRSFMVNTYYPLYSHFFGQLGFTPVVPDFLSQKGIDQKDASFCYPAELAHGFFHALLESKEPPDVVFLPYFKALPTHIADFTSQVCPFVQGETFYLQTTFQNELDALKKRGTRIIAPLIDLTQGDWSAQTSLVDAARSLGIDAREAKRAFQTALEQQTRCFAEMKAIGRQMVSSLEEDPEKIMVVLFGRAYNAFVEEAHMGIPHKLASRGVSVIPFDFLEFDDEKSKHHMYWGIGQRLMKAARRVKRHPQLFGTYITNFSCGPDSFLIGYFRDIMGQKPSLTLELDSHTADAGLETRIEAFLDIVSAYRRITARNPVTPKINAYSPARVLSENKAMKIKTSSGKTLPVTDSRVTVLFPSMGKVATESLASVFRGAGYHASAHPPADEAILKLGRANTSCKECLPLILTTGSLLNYVQNHKKENEVLVYFMPTTSGPCRFGQYSVFMNDLIQKMRIPDVALFSLTAENTYAGLGNGFEKKIWWAVVTSDVMEDIRSMLLVDATNPQEAMAVFDNAWQQVLKALETGDLGFLQSCLKSVSFQLRQIPLKRPAEEVPVISLIGEIFVRRDGISRQYITERLAEKGFAVRCAPVSEWLYYLDVLALKGLSGEVFTPKKKLGVFIKNRFKTVYESKIKSILAQSGLIHNSAATVKTIMENGARYIPPTLGGEAILTVGSALTEVATHACGVISIGPFGCMPTRLSEAILSETMNRKVKLSIEPKNKQLKNLLSDMDELPFLSIESDGSPFPQLISAKIESFCLRANRLHRRMREFGPPAHSSF
jgi:predicted CoA-substrate-specific enzyme activase